jgi:hypothetical protein
VKTDRQGWLSITPEPEGELPAAIATLRAGGEADPAAVRAERDRAARLITRGRRGAYERWLAEARSLTDAPAPNDEDAREAADVAGDVLENHDALALGLTPRDRGGRGGRRR